jgi:hypothetical protein
LRAKGHKTKEERFMRESYGDSKTEQKKFQDFVGVMRSQLSVEKGNRFYLTDKEFYEKYGADKGTVDEWLRAGAVESLGEVEERLTNPSLQPDPVGEQISPGVQVNRKGKPYNNPIDGDLPTKAEPFVSRAVGLITNAPNLTPTNTQVDNSGSRLDSGFEEFQQLSVDSENISVTNLDYNSGADTSNAGGGTRQSLPSTINPDLPTFTGMAGGWT